ncbi:unnamed protein product [Linum trigynum]|uniref:Uncharacterized protein n=1 Tax=Linum trigynum TaxID=586398 RepID=A0AAV2G6R6_9ROSI
MATFTGHSAEPCYTPQEDPNKQSRLLVEQFARDTERSCSKLDPFTKAIAQTEFSYHETEETLWSIKKSLEEYDVVSLLLDPT